MSVEKNRARGMSTYGAFWIVAVLWMAACGGDSIEPPASDGGQNDAACEAAKGASCDKIDGGKIDGGRDAMGDEAIPKDSTNDEAAPVDHGGEPTPDGDAHVDGTDANPGSDGDVGTPADAGADADEDTALAADAGADAPQDTVGDEPDARTSDGDTFETDALVEDVTETDHSDASIDGGEEAAAEDAPVGTGDTGIDVATDAASDAPPVTAPGCGGCFAGDLAVAGRCSVPAAACWRPVPHATLVLRNGACAIESCYPGWGDCDGDVSNGCELDITVPERCGSCQNACATGEACAAGVCVASCPLSTTDCSGACSNLDTAPRHCGSCSLPCAAPSNYAATCTAAQCGSDVVCPVGTTACLGACADPLNCPICSNLDVDPAHCGGCSNACAIPEGGTTSCVSGACVPHCPSGATLCGGRCVVTRSDPNNCGTCGQACPSGICTGGACVAGVGVIATAGAPTDLLVDATSVYFIDSADATVNRVDKNGGSPAPLATSQPGPLRLAQDGAYVYWSNATDGSIVRARKDGSAPPEPVVPSGAEGPVAVDDSYVYWGVWNGTCGLTCGLYRAPKDGSAAPSQLWRPLGITATAPANLVADGAFVYWSGVASTSSSFVQNVIQIDKTTGTGTVLAQGGKGALAVDATHVYVTQGSAMIFGVPHYVLAIDKASHDTTTLFMIAVDSTTGYGELTVDETYVFRNGPASGGLARLIKCEIRAPGQTMSPLSLTHLVNDDTYVYGIAGPTIRRIPK